MESRRLPIDCAGGRMQFTLEVGVWRCAPMTDSRTGPIEPGDTWPEGMMLDLAALRRAFLCCDWITDKDLSPRITNIDRKSTRLNSSHVAISYAVFCLKKKSNVY